MSPKHPLLAVRVSHDTLSAVRAFAAARPELTLKEILEDAIHQYLTSIGDMPNTLPERAVRLRPGRRSRTPILEDAVVLLEDGQEV
jgi:hypothetical protein